VDLLPSAATSGFAKSEESASAYRGAQSPAVPFLFHLSARGRVSSRSSSSFVRGLRTTFSALGKRSIVQQARLIVKSTRSARNHQEWYMSNRSARSIRSNAQSS
jgi:hypothetical protein